MRSTRTSGYGLAGRALERAASERYEDFIGREFLAPLGMVDSGFFLDGRAAAALATGYDTDARSVLPYWNMLYRPFGGLNAQRHATWLPSCSC